MTDTADNPDDALTEAVKAERTEASRTDLKTEKVAAVKDDPPPREAIPEPGVKKTVSDSSGAKDEMRPAREPADDGASESTVTATREPADEPASESTATATRAPAEDGGSESTATATREPADEPASASTVTATREPADEPPSASTATATPDPADVPAPGDRAAGDAVMTDTKHEGSKLTEPDPSKFADVSGSDGGDKQTDQFDAAESKPDSPKATIAGDDHESTSGPPKKSSEPGGTADAAPADDDEPPIAEDGSLPDELVDSGPDAAHATSSPGDEATVSESAVAPSADPLDAAGFGEQAAEQIATDPSITGEPLDPDTDLPGTPPGQDARFEDAAPGDDDGGFTPGDLADALKGEREHIFGGIVDPPTEFGLQPDQLDADAVGAVDPRETVSTDSAGGLVDPLISADEPPKKKPPPPPPPPKTKDDDDNAKPQPAETQESDSSDSGSSDGDDEDDGIDLSGIMETEVTEGGDVEITGVADFSPVSSAKTVVGKIWDAISSDEDDWDQSEEVNAVGGVRGRPLPDAPESGDMPDGLDLVLGGAPEPAETDVMGTLIQHQEPGDAAVDADQARALLSKAANPLDPYIDPGEDDGDVPDGIYVPGGGIEETDPFESLIQPPEPDGPLGDPSSASSVEADVADSAASGPDDPLAGLDDG